MFDLNMKPNATGPGRPGRADQDSLVAMAARAVGWDFPDLLLNCLANPSWSVGVSGVATGLRANVAACEAL